MTTKFNKEIAKRNLEIQVGGFADQASGSCLVRYGDTSVLSTAQLGQEKEDIDFFPLTCDYEEKYYAAGRIGGSRFIRREGRPSTEAILVSRMIDRTIRPLFPDNFFSEVQVINTCLSWDEKNDPGILGILGSSIALLVSEIPWRGPVAAVRVAMVDGQFVLNPNYKQREESRLDIVFSGQKNGDGRVSINMIEGGALEASEEEVSKALNFALPAITELLDFQEEIARKISKKKISFGQESLGKEVEAECKEFLKQRLEQALFNKDKQEREKSLRNLEEELIEKVKEKFGLENTRQIKIFFEKSKKELLRESILKYEKRIDNRRLDEVREIKVEAGILPRTHGSAIFSRGMTKVLSILTLGSPSDQQLLEGMEIVKKKRFLHHYNFPPYCSGDVKRIGSPNRREIGHGMLAEKALRPLIPSFDDFPYTIRVVSEVLSSNGSTSMASVSAASLALMDAGVPVLRNAAGIAIGIIRDGDNYKMLTDIQGPEDSLGEMDFKVAGTKIGITAIQMDVKGEGITEEIFKEALARAKRARNQILDIQDKLLARPRQNLSEFAPRVYVIKINPEKIGSIIGPGGRTVNEIIEGCGVSIDIEESGKVFITAEKEEAAKKAIDWIKSLTRELKVGEVFQGKVKRILDFGAIIEIVPGQEGLCHISQFAPFRINKIRDVVKVGDIIPVKIISIDQQGRINLSAMEAGFKVGQRSRINNHYNGKKSRA
ncbi:polyribonucleotide nucleotidyltransferase [bacterium]|nr:polyribonucleotide nucleotidyltransferase [bacterium]